MADCTPTARSDIEVNAANEEGWTALHIATAFGRREVVLALLNTTDVEVNGMDNDGMTPLHFASRDGKLEVVREWHFIWNLDSS